jgi:hypothetical protein
LPPILVTDAASDILAASVFLVGPFSRFRWPMPPVCRRINYAGFHGGRFRHAHVSNRALTRFLAIGQKKPYVFITEAPFSSSISAQLVGRCQPLSLRAVEGLRLLVPDPILRSKP